MTGGEERQPHGRHIDQLFHSFVQAVPLVGVLKREQFMRSRSILRSICVGAALLVPAGGLAVLDAGTAGAATATLVSVSKVKIGTFVNITLIGKSLFTKTTAVGTQLIKITTVTTQGGHITARLTGTLRVTIVTTSGTKTINKVKIKPGASILITGSTSGGFKGCVIGSLPVIDYGSTHVLKWTSAGNPLSGVSISGSPCTTPTALAGVISGHKLNSTLTFSAA